MCLDTRGGKIAKNTKMLRIGGRDSQVINLEDKVIMKNPQPHKPHRDHHREGMTMNTWSKSITFGFALILNLGEMGSDLD